MTNRRQKEYYNEKLFRCIFDREDVCFFPYDYAVIEESDRLASLLKEHPELEEEEYGPSEEFLKQIKGEMKSSDPLLDARYGLLKNSEQLDDLKKRISWYQRRKERPYMSYSEETAQAVAEEIARINRLLQEHPEQAEETYIPPEEYLAQIKGTMFW